MSHPEVLEPTRREVDCYFGPRAEANRRWLSHVALEANFEGKRSEEGCYGVGGRRGIVNGGRRIRFD
jgi:hypothetical protein